MIYFLLLTNFSLVMVNLILWSKLTLWKMEHDLETWIDFGTGEDIVICKDQRKEYQHYVNMIDKDSINIPAKALKLIREDLKSKTLFKLVYFKLLWLKIKGYNF